MGLTQPAGIFSAQMEKKHSTLLIFPSTKKLLSLAILPHPQEKPPLTFISSCFDYVNLSSKVVLKNNIYPTISEIVCFYIPFGNWL